MCQRVKFEQAGRRGEESGRVGVGVERSVPGGCGDLLRVLLTGDRSHAGGGDLPRRGRATRLRLWRCALPYPPHFAVLNLNSLTH